ncbi:hypothetical protein ABCS02_08905 [Microbacterium sp. X-17]|uniref:hypothetical protein n=1 Tax=Microbacterium sp. X-17 TaxID=3144404 RepID=UPI0031F4B4C3
MKRNLEAPGKRRSVTQLLKGTLGVAAIITLVTTATSAASANQADTPLQVDLGTAAVTEADGTPLNITWTQDDPAQAIGVATLSNGKPAQIT